MPKYVEERGVLLLFEIHSIKGGLDQRFVKERAEVVTGSKASPSTCSCLDWVQLGDTVIGDHPL